MEYSRSNLAALLAAPMGSGRVVWTGVRPGRRAPWRALDAVVAVAGIGLEGDHYHSRHGGKRQVTLIQAEDLAAIAAYLGRVQVDPGLLRRNIVTERINLRALKDKRFRVGSAILEYSGPCHPCSRMEENLGTGGFNAVRGHGGITARVIQSGQIRAGDEVVVCSPGEASGYERVGL